VSSRYVSGSCLSFIGAFIALPGRLIVARVMRAIHKVMFVALLASGPSTTIPSSSMTACG
jgi:hypothetical protein